MEKLKEEETECKPKERESVPTGKKDSARSDGSGTRLETRSLIWAVLSPVFLQSEVEKEVRERKKERENKRWKRRALKVGEKYSVIFFFLRSRWINNGYTKKENNGWMWLVPRLKNMELWALDRSQVNAFWNWCGPAVRCDWIQFLPHYRDMGLLRWANGPYIIQ